MKCNIKFTKKSVEKLKMNEKFPGFERKKIKWFVVSGQKQTEN